MQEGTATTMQCPACAAEATLVAVDRNGVLVDACPRCRGVWLDRGELDKLIELEASGSDAFLDEIRGGSRQTERRDEGRDERGGHHGSKHGSSYGQSPKKKRRSGGFLGEMFDFG